MVATVEAQIAAGAQWLWQGGSLYGAPEGVLSPDGTLSPITAGLHRLLRASPPETRLVPIFVIYDFMTTRRPRIFVDFAPAIAQAPGLTSAELNARLRRAWPQSAHFTCTQLASGFLSQASDAGARPFTLAELAEHIERRAAELAAAGRHVDRRLLRPGRAQTGRELSGLLRAARPGARTRTGALASAQRPARLRTPPGRRGLSPGSPELRLE